MIQHIATAFYNIYSRNSSEDSISNNDSSLFSERNINEQDALENINEINQNNNIEQNLENLNKINQIDGLEQDIENNIGINQINCFGKDLDNPNGIKCVNINFKRIVIILLIVFILLVLTNILITIIIDFKNSKNSKEKDNKDKIDDPVILKNAIWDGYETNVGAHYYAYTSYSNEYTQVKGLLKLPDSINTNYGRRNAYISFGILGINGGINIGLINSGTGGWRPLHYFHKTHKMVCYNDYHSDEKTDYIEIIIEVTQDRKILATFNLKNSTLFTIKSLNFEIDASDILEYENGKVKFRFFRFVSLVPIEKDNQNDGTFIKKGKFIGLSIVKNNKTESWGISGDNIEDSWIISSKRIQVDYRKSEESFSIIHSENPF